MKLSARLKIVIPLMLLAGVILFAIRYFTGWFIPTGTIIPGAPMELMRISQNDKEVRISTRKKGKIKQQILHISNGKPLQYKFDYKEKIFIEQAILVNGTPVKGTYRDDNGANLNYTVTFIPGEKRDYVLLLQIDWLVERHRLLERFRGKAWKTNFSVRNHTK
jgi:hypothetical protein